jgi:ribosomal protein S7
MVGDVKCVVIDERLRQIEPLAYHFVLNFANDNNLVTTQACLMPELAAASSGKTPATTSQK